MIQLTWVLFWLSFYLGVGVPYTVVNEPLPADRIGEARFDDKVIAVDIAAMEKMGRGSWDTTVYAACTIVHESWHLNTGSFDHELPLYHEYRCYDAFMQAVWPTRGIRLIRTDIYNRYCAVRTDGVKCGSVVIH